MIIIVSILACERIEYKIKYRHKKSHEPPDTAEWLRGGCQIVRNEFQKRMQANDSL